MEDLQEVLEYLNLVEDAYRNEFKKNENELRRNKAYLLLNPTSTFYKKEVKKAENDCELMEKLISKVIKTKKLVRGK